MESEPMTDPAKLETFRFHIEADADSGWHDTLERLGLQHIEPDTPLPVPDTPTPDQLILKLALGETRVKIEALEGEQAGRTVEGDAEGVNFRLVLPVLTHAVEPNGIAIEIYGPTGRALLSLPDVDRKTVRDVAARNARAGWVLPDEARAVLQPDRRHTIPHGTTPMPTVLPQQTFPEARHASIALADGPMLRRWKPENVPGHAALRHTIPGDPLEVLLKAGPTLLDWWGRPADLDTLKTELREAGVPAVLLWHVVLYMALKHHELHVAIDDLVSRIGMDPRSRRERVECRRRVWRWLGLFESLYIIGARHGKYRDPDTRELLDLTTRDVFIRITGEDFAGQLSMDHGEPPLRVHLATGPFLNRFRGDRRILSDFGDVLRLSAIPGGRPSGAWAQSIGLALQQRWREQAAKSTVRTVGQDKHQTVRFPKPFTRRELLDTFPPDPTADSILSSEHPDRAKTYWNTAIRLLKDARVIGHYKGLDPEPQGYRWSDAWLDQKLDIRPRTTEDIAALVEVSEAAHRAQKRRTRSAK